MRKNSLVRWSGVLFAAMVFGVTLSVIKGNAAGVREVIGNVSAPWLLLPFVGARLVTRGRPATGAAVGLVLTFTALSAFYVTNVAVLNLGPHPLLTDVRLTVMGGQRYFALALLSGPVFGALGGWSHRSKAGAVLAASLLVVEPVAWEFYAHLSPAHFDNPAVVRLGEAFLGLTLFAAVAFHSQRHPLDF